jgi:hypothetical protein
MSGELKNKPYLRGSDTWPVISLLGAIGVLLYGIFGARGSSDCSVWMDEMRAGLC